MKRVRGGLLVGALCAVFIPSCGDSVVALSTECPSAQKMCTEPGTGKQLCVGTSDPQYGCSAPSCIPCTTLLPGTKDTRCSSNLTCERLTCATGYLDCDGNAENGCEVNATIGTPDPMAQAVRNCGLCTTPQTTSSYCTVPAGVRGEPVCSNGACSVDCAAVPPWQNCNVSNLDGCETDTSTSTQHCGGCNKPCAGACVNGVCRDTDASTTPPPPRDAGRADADGASPAACAGLPSPTRVVNSATVDAFAVTSSYLYWLDDQPALMRQPKLNEMPAKVVDLVQRGNKILVDPNRIYWAESSSIYGMPFDLSSGATRVAVGVTHWAVGGDSVFYTNGVVIESVPKTGGAAKQLVDDVVGIRTMAADATGLYWFEERGDAASAGIEKFWLGTGSAGTFKFAQHVRILLADGSRVAWVDEPWLLGPGTILWSTPAGSDPIAAASGQRTVLHLVIDDVNAYFTSGDPGGSVDLVKVPLGGGTPRHLACALQQLRALAVDESDVYFSSALGGIWKVSKSQ